VSETPFGQYQLVEKIAQGGMAEIFRGKALDVDGLERDVVIKRILPHIAASPEFVDMLVDEAKIAVMLSHGNIAQVYDLGKVADDYFIVMEYVDGKTLSQLMKRLRNLGKHMPVPYACYVVQEIANALDYMHRKTDEEGNPLNIVHRDISPQNAILSTAGTVKLIDFGIAKAKTKVSTTDSGVLKGKFAYMSPEHAEGMKLDHRTDLFSLGVILFEMLTGQRLFKGKNNLETVRRVKKAKVPTPSGIRSSIPKALDKIVFKSLQKDRAKRYQSAHDISQDLTKLLVQHYPEFTPRELARYLKELFPEFGPAERGPPENTPRVPLEVKRESTAKTELSERRDGGPEENDFREDTLAADSEVLRSKLKDTEVFSVTGASVTPISQNDSHAPSEEEEHTTRIWMKPGARFGAAALILVLIAASIGLGVRHARRKAHAKLVHDQIMDAVKTRETIARKMSETRPSSQKPDTPAMPPAPVKPVVAEAKAPAPPAPSPPKQPPTAVVPEGLGSLVVDSEPKGAKIYLNDVDTSRKTPFTFDNLKPGPQKIGLYLDRYGFWQGESRVEPGKTSKISTALALNFGSLEINSLPSGAAVSLNGKTAGKTPFHLEQLDPDTVYDVMLEIEGYESWKGSAKIFGGKSEALNISLKKKRPELPLPE